MFIYSLTMFFLSLMLTFSSHPVSIMIVILTQTLFICLNMWILMKTSWFAYILFLIFLGGLMVLFIYIVSLASNEKFEINKEIFIQMMITLSLIMILIFMSSFFLTETSNKMVNFSKTVMMVFSSSITSPTVIIMTYLLFTLVVAVKVASKFEGPLRNFIS